MRFRVPFLLAAILLLGSSAAEVSASPWIHAHRGGPLENGKAALSENSMPAFREAAARGFVIEADVKLSTDNVPMVIHDDELNRTTNCTGPVSALTAAQLGDCEIDVIGIGDQCVQLPPDCIRRSPVPTLAELLALLKETGASANIEIKNLPTDNDWDPTYDYAEKIADVVVESGCPRPS